MADRANITRDNHRKTKQLVVTEGLYEILVVQKKDPNSGEKQEINCKKTDQTSRKESVLSFYLGIAPRSSEISHRVTTKRIHKTSGQFFQLISHYTLFYTTILNPNPYDTPSLWVSLGITSGTLSPISITPVWVCLRISVVDMNIADC